jgi:transcriptional regulator with XRE-family HTH domain
VSNLRKGRIENPGFDKLRAIAKAMNFPPELWFEDVENLRDVSAVRPSWFVDGEDNLALLDEELLEALRDETARAVLREVIRLPERDRKIVLGIVRQFQGMSG